MENLTSGIPPVRYLPCVVPCKLYFGVFLLIISGFEEQCRDLLKAFLLGLGCKIGVLVACLGLTGKGSHQVFFGLSSCVFRFFHGGYYE